MKTLAPRSRNEFEKCGLDIPSQKLAESHCHSKLIEQAAKLILDGQVVAYPTETFWGLAVLPSSQEGVDRIVKYKQRAPDKGLSLIVSDMAMAEALSSFDSGASLKAFQRLAGAFWPGPLTVVVSPSQFANQTLNPRVFAPDGSLALRVSSMESARLLAKLAGGMITATSANPADLPPASSSAEVLGYYPDIFICEDISRIPSNENSSENPNAAESFLEKEHLPSTILDIRKDPFSIIRQGAISAEQLYAILE